MTSLAPLNALEDLTSRASAVASSATSAASSAVSNAGAMLPTPSNLTKAVMIILGLLLVAAGIFSFDKTKTFVVNAAKAGAAAAA